MIGLIAQAVGMAAQMGASMMQDKEFVKEETVYTPDAASFGDAGLFNNVIGNSGRTDTYSIETEENKQKSGLMGLGTMLSSSSSFLDGLENSPEQKALNKQERIDNRAARVERRTARRAERNE